MRRRRYAALDGGGPGHAAERQREMHPADAFLDRARAAGWEFDYRETSANVYLFEGTDRFGRTLSRQGTEAELEEMLATLEADMAAMGRQDD